LGRRRARAPPRGLEEQGRLDDSWIFVLADHGESLGEDGGFGHRLTISDDVVHVPLIIRPPGGTTGDTSPESSSSPT
jgi:arylsulfatase A-like enzyme